MSVEVETVKVEEEIDTETKGEEGMDVSTAIDVDGDLAAPTLPKRKAIKDPYATSPHFLITLLIPSAHLFTPLPSLHATQRRSNFEDPNNTGDTPTIPTPA